MTTQPLPEVTIQSERRRFHRKKFRGKLEIEWGSAVLTGEIRDIAPGGLFVEMSTPLWIGAEFRARLLLKPVILLNCTVVRVEPGKGIGVTIEVIEESGKTQMEALLMSLSPA
jgi:hypothetical protein